MRVLMLLVPDPVAATQRYLTLDRIAAAYYLFEQAGVEVVMASPEGGAPEISAGAADTALVEHFARDRGARDAISDTLAVSQVDSRDFAAAYCAGAIESLGGIGADRARAILDELLAAGKPVAILPAHPTTTQHSSGLLILGSDARTSHDAASAVLAAIGGQRPPLAEGL